MYIIKFLHKSTKMKTNCADITVWNVEKLQFNNNMYVGPRKNAKKHLHVEKWRCLKAEVGSFAYVSSHIAVGYYSKF